MTSIHRSALVEYSDQQMFDLVNAIEHYPEFMPGCVSARVISQSSTELVGRVVSVQGGHQPAIHHPQSAVQAAAYRDELGGRALQEL